MTEEIHPEQDTRGGADKIGDLVRDSNEKLLAHLIGLTADKGESLSIEELQAASKAFNDFQSDFLKQSIDETWRSCVQIIEAMRWRNNRKFHLDRLLVQSFSDLFPDRDIPSKQEIHLSRRIILGFLAGIQQMLGDDLHTQLDKRAEALVKSVTNPLTGIVPWDNVNENETGALIVQNVLVFAARFFSDMAKRRNWMIDVVDSHMPPTHDEQEKSWNFGDQEFHILMDAIYSPLRTQVSNEEGREIFRQIYSRADLDTVQTLIAGLEQDYRDLTSSGAL
ncbi:MAG: hypothetical protein ACJAU6_004299 [Alphaproteobacteria bacterium]